MVMNCKSDRLGFLRILRNWRLLRKGRAKDIAFYGITCNYCAPRILVLPRHKRKPAGLVFVFKELKLTELNKACTYCDIIRRVHSHLVDTAGVNDVDTCNQNMYDGFHLKLSTLSGETELVYLCSLGTCVLPYESNNLMT
jgi:DNA-directed RNA polymerase subunit RPC12/RpoP